ncbi:MAG: FAD-linked oxidase C-terminal domain-containing protein [Candidatus Methylacidiphilales bacterium]|nr:FAD-linked oxidase C-terminal domain-containing protein [Candidatus Methylacidiphilales bacterium]
MKTPWLPKLRKLFGRRILQTDPETLAAHAGDAWHASHPPEAVALPSTTAEVSRLLTFCHRHRIPVTARGAGRGYVGSCVPVRGGVALSLARMNRIREISREDFVAVVEPGVITGELQRRVEARGLFYPPDPASLNESTIGGNIATNAGGPRCVKYGVTRNYVMGLEIVLADGTVVTTGGRTHKNKLGFNLTDLFTGSEGMLGITTLATLRLIPLPPARAVVVGTFPHARAAAAAVQAVLARGFLPSAMEVADAFTLASARKYSPGTPPGNAFLLLEVDGQSASVRGESRDLAVILESCGALRVFRATTTAAQDRLWGMRRDFSYSLKATGLHKINQDIVVPRGKLVQVFKLSEQLKKKYRVETSAFGHAGDGNIHVNLMFAKGEEHAPRVRLAQDELFRRVLEMGGTITGEHGTGLARKPWWNLATTAGSRKLHQLVKQALDPLNILNPGKFLG